MTTTAPMEIITVASGPAVDPSSAQRNPSTTPTIGLSAKSGRQASGTMEVGYTTGVAKNHSCARNGSVYRISRYLTFSAESQKPTPSAVMTVSNAQSGTVQMPPPIVTP